MVSFLVNHITLILIKQMIFLNHYSLPYVIRKFQASVLEFTNFFMVDMVKQIWGSETFIDYTATCNLSVYFVLSAIKIDGWRESIIKETIFGEINGLCENCKSLEWGRGHKVTLVKAFVCIHVFRQCWYSGNSIP